MYQVKIYEGPDDTEGTKIHSPTSYPLKLLQGIINREINKIDSFNFSILPNNPAFGHLKPYNTFLKVYNTKTQEYDFEGRIWRPSEELTTNGTVTYSYIAEGELGYLKDSVQQHVEFRGTPKELFTTILNYHNTQVAEYQRFEVGTVTVTDPNDYMYLYLNAVETTWEALKRTLLDKLGGEFRIRKVGGVRFLDYVERVGIDSNVSIKLNKNLVSMSRDIDPSDIVTRLTPLGERIESEDEDATDASQERLTIKSVNNGVPYLDRPDLIEAFGIKGRSETWDDITTPQILKTRGQQFLDNQKLVLYQYTVEALDLFLIGLDPTGFKVGNSYPLINPVMNIMGERLRIIKQQIDINSPQDGNLTIGDKFKTQTDYQVDLNKSARNIVLLEDDVVGLRRQQGTIRTSLSEAQENLTVVQQTLANINADNLPESLAEINRQIEAVRRAIDEIEIPVYELATRTSDGLMSSEDKTKLDDLEIPDYVDEFEQINSTLNDLVGRVEELESE